MMEIAIPDGEICSFYSYSGPVSVIIFIVFIILGTCKFYVFNSNIISGYHPDSFPCGNPFARYCFHLRTAVDTTNYYVVFINSRICIASIVYSTGVNLYDISGIGSIDCILQFAVLFSGTDLQHLWTGGRRPYRWGGFH